MSIYQITFNYNYGCGNVYKILDDRKQIIHRWNPSYSIIVELITDEIGMGHKFKTKLIFDKEQLMQKTVEELDKIDTVFGEKIKDEKWIWYD